MCTKTALRIVSTGRSVPAVSFLAVLATGICLAGSAPCPAASEPGSGPALNVRQFGARGDGEADDTAAVHAGVAAALESGRTLFLPKGTYLIQKPIRVTGYGLKIVGAGAQHTVLKASAEMDRLLYLRGTGMVISRLTLNAGGKATYGLHAFHLNEQDSRLEFLRVVGAKSHGIFLDHSQVFEVSNCIAQGNGGDGFYISDCNGTEISVCRAIENRGRGFCVTTTDLSGGCWLLGCDAEMNACEGLLVSGMAGTPVVVERMWVEANSPKNDAVRVVSRSVMLTKCRISTRGDEPLRPKYAIHLASETQLALEQTSGSFKVGETVKGSQSGATGVVSLWQADPLFTDEFPIPKPYKDWLDRPKKLMLRDISGSFRPKETISGQTTGAGAVVRSVSQVCAQNCVVTENWVAREQGRAPVDRIHLDPGCVSNHIGRNYRMWGAGVVGVDAPDDPGVVVGGRSVTTGSGPPTSGQWPLGAFRFNRSPSFRETSVLGKDIISNGNLEQDEGWSHYGTPRVNEQSREQSHGGANSRKVVGSGGAGVRQYLKAASPGQRYIASGWLYVAKGTARFIVYDGKKLQYGTTVADPRWTKVTLSFSVVEGSTPYIGVQSVGGDSLFYLDDVTCIPVERIEGSSRLMLGWVCTAGGSPGTWVPVYVLKEP